jgi:ABC-type multidrug transport system fused ATPase/permease subunit
MCVAGYTYITYTSSNAIKQVSLMDLSSIEDPSSKSSLKIKMLKSIFFDVVLSLVLMKSLQILRSKT